MHFLDKVPKLNIWPISDSQYCVQIMKISKAWPDFTSAELIKLHVKFIVILSYGSQANAEKPLRWTDQWMDRWADGQSNNIMPPVPKPIRQNLWHINFYMQWETDQSLLMTLSWLKKVKFSGFTSTGNV